MIKSGPLRAFLVVALYVVASTGLGDLWARLTHAGHSDSLLPPVWIDVAIVVAVFPASIGAGMTFVSLSGGAVMLALAMSPLVAVGIRLVLDDPGPGWIAGNTAQLLGASALSGVASVLGHLAAKRWRRL